MSYLITHTHTHTHTQTAYLHSNRNLLLSFNNISALVMTASIFCWRVLLVTADTAECFTAVLRPILTLASGNSDLFEAWGLLFNTGFCSVFSSTLGCNIDDECSGRVFIKDASSLAYQQQPPVSRLLH